ncbi:MAG: LysR family transcriptional regulator [Lachnospiraceae bacterium]|nr:LysR family transcriptional regulator [Lachnospiraceae bacterium]
MTDVQLLTFISIYECNSFSKAAQKLYVPQSTISHRLEQLEHQLNVKLFQRNARSLSLTPAGKVFLPHARKILETINDMEIELQGLHVQGSEQFRIGSSNLLIQYLLRDHLPYFMQTYENTRFSIISRSSDNILEELEKHNIDVSITNYSMANPGMTFSPLLVDEVVLFGSTSLWKENAISNRALSSCPILVFPAERLFHSFIKEQLMQRGVTLNKIIEVENIDLIKEMVISGMGLSFLPKLYVKDILDSNKAKEISTPEMVKISRTTYIGYNNDTVTPLQKRFVAELSKAVASTYHP